MKALIERFNFVLFAGGFGLFIFSVVAQAVLPFMVLKDIPYATADKIAENVDPAFTDMARRWEKEFKTYYPGGATPKNYAEALRLGKKVYIQEACWHCHSQFVRPVSNESVRWGKVSYPAEYQTEFHLPPLLGTRRVGPDLSREAWVHSNDWHAAHFYRPTDVAPVSVMPDFPWLFDKNKVPNKKGMGLIAYVQWLGSWIPEEDRAGGGTLNITREMMDKNRGKFPQSTAAPAAAAKPAAAAAPAAAEAAPAAAAAPVKETLEDIPVRKDPWAKEENLDKPWTVGIE